jgi:hypothetical protein
MLLILFLGCDIALRLVTGIPTQWPRFDPISRDMGFMVGKVVVGRFPTNSLVSPANSHSTDRSTFINYLIIDDILILTASLNIQFNKNYIYCFLGSLIMSVSRRHEEETPHLPIPRADTGKSIIKYKVTIIIAVTEWAV